MSGLVEYASSDDDHSDQVESPDLPSGSVARGPNLNGSDSLSRSKGALATPQNKSESSTVLMGADIHGQASLNSDISDSMRPSYEVISRSTSPFSTDRAAIRSFTLPQHPILDIPPSPPGSPDPAMEARVSHFRNLKRQRVHFNAKLSSATALKNPGLFPKLMSSAGLTHPGAQYATSLEPGQWDPQVFPSEAFADEIDRIQKDMQKRKQLERVGSERDFVGASRTAK